MPENSARFSVGELIHHRLFGYRGVIIDVDACFTASQGWYERVARSRPPRDKPWYRVLPHDSADTTYVAERNLEFDDEPAPIEHPLLRQFFTEFRDKRYVAARRLN